MYLSGGYEPLVPATVPRAACHGVATSGLSPPLVTYGLGVLEAPVPMYTFDALNEAH